MQKYVVYLRVSTAEQGKSGLGLDAQKRDIELFLSNYSDTPYAVVGTFTDILSGADNSRPELEKAIALAKSEKAELLVAKLDRLSRKVAFIANLLDDKKIQLRVASMPNADTFQLHIYAALAQQEREFISLRTKAALQQAKERGVKLGGYRTATALRNEAMSVQADTHAVRVSAIVKPMRDAGATLQAIADALNAAKVATPRGATWYPASVKNALARL